MVLLTDLSSVLHHLSSTGTDSTSQMTTFQSVIPSNTNRQKEGSLCWWSCVANLLLASILHRDMNPMFLSLSILCILVIFSAASNTSICSTDTHSKLHITRWNEGLPQTLNPHGNTYFIICPLGKNTKTLRPQHSRPAIPLNQCPQQDLTHTDFEINLWTRLWCYTCFCFFILFFIYRSELFLLSVAFN